MKLTFIQGGSKVKCAEDGTLYTDSNFSNSIWRRYSSYSHDLTVILRKDVGTYVTKEAQKQFNAIDTEIFNLIVVPNIYNPATSYFDLHKRKIIKKAIYDSVKESDKVIIRSVATYYTVYAAKCCIVLKKPYLIEITGFAKETSWNHSLLGKFIAYHAETIQKKYVSDAPYAVYVTEYSLQERYPCKGKTLGCSDVELEPVDYTVLESKLNSIDMINGKIILGTAAHLDVKFKGQRFVIMAIAKLREEGIKNIEYHVIGNGTGNALKNLIIELDLDNEVKILGSVPHKHVFPWLDSIDIYIQPSFQEGLCRSAVEAMSRACPILMSDCGGNRELQTGDFLFKKGSIDSICSAIKKMLPIDTRRIEIRRSYERAKDFEKSKLDAKRDTFYLKFINENIYT